MISDYINEKLYHAIVNFDEDDEAREYYHLTTDKWTVDSSLKKASNGAAVIFFRAL